jgi:hypothetical protein
VPAPQDCTDEELIDGVDALHRLTCTVQRNLFSYIAEVDRRELWQDSGARDMAHWLWMRFGTSDWKARRWIASAQALESLPQIAEAFSKGELGIDKVVELTRFATPETEHQLISWAQRVSCGAIRHKGDLAIRRSKEDVGQVERSRSVSWNYFDDGRRFGLEAYLPAAEGAVVAKALERLADEIPVVPGEEQMWAVDARRADALVALCSSRIASDADADRATVIVHASLESLVQGAGGSEIEGDGVISGETVRRLACNARVQVVLEDGAGLPVRLGRITRDPPAWMMRQLRYRDRECQFPGCGSRRFVQAHHIAWWEKGGRTDLENLALICTFHHRLVHEYGWRLCRDRDGTVRWFLPTGTRYCAGPGPPAETSQPEPVLSATGSSDSGVW